jgi:hexosaminidase
METLKKMSQFHWHVVDSQSFPLTVPEFPELAQKGAYSSQEIYSSADVQDIVNYAGAVSSTAKN